MEITTLVRQVAAGALLRELQLRAGSELAVRVVSAPQAGGRGEISLAGLVLRAQLPPGLAAGQKLAVQVARADQGELVLKVLHDGAPGQSHERGEVARAAGALAVAGDPRLVEVASALQQPGFALPLPNGDALTLALDPDEDGEEGEGERSEGEAAFVLHSAALGPIEVRLRLGGGTLGVAVVVDPAAEELTRAAAPELARALARVTPAQPSVEVSARRGRPAPPRVEETLDAYG
jgi:hypothetical protein